MHASADALADPARSPVREESDLFADRLVALFIADPSAMPRVVHPSLPHITRHHAWLKALALRVLAGRPAWDSRLQPIDEWLSCFLRSFPSLVGDTDVRRAAGLLPLDSGIRFAFQTPSDAPVLPGHPVLAYDPSVDVQAYAFTRSGKCDVCKTPGAIDGRISLAMAHTATSAREILRAEVCRPCAREHGDVFEAGEHSDTAYAFRRTLLYAHGRFVHPS